MDRSPLEKIDIPVVCPIMHRRVVEQLRFFNAQAERGLEETRRLLMKVVVALAMTAFLLLALIERLRGSGVFLGAVVLGTVVVCASCARLLNREHGFVRASQQTVIGLGYDIHTLAHLEGELIGAADALNLEIWAWNLAASARWHAADESIALAARRTAIEARRRDMLAAASLLDVAGRARAETERPKTPLEAFPSEREYIPVP